MADKCIDAGPSNSLQESLVESLGLASETFDPMNVLYAPSVGFFDENVEAYSSASQFMRNFNVVPPPNRSCENSSALQDIPKHSTPTVSLAVPDTKLSTHADTLKKESVGNVTVREENVKQNMETMASADEPGKSISPPRRRRRIRRTVISEMQTGKSVFYFQGQTLPWTDKSSQS